MNSSIESVWVIRASRHRTHIGGPQRVSRTWQRMGVVVSSWSYGKREQVQSYACQMLCEIIARHNEEWRKRWLMCNRRTMDRVVDDGRSVSSWTACGQNEIVSTLYVSAEFRHRVSDDTKKHREIRTFEQCIDRYLQHRRTEDSLPIRRQEGEARTICTCKILEMTTWVISRGSIPARKFATEQTEKQEIFLQ